MKLGVIIAAVVISIIASIICFFGYVVSALAKTFNKEYKVLSDRDILELENSEYNYGHDINHEAY